jgi:heat shock protein HslJ
MKNVIHFAALSAVTLLLAGCGSIRPTPSDVPASLAGSRWRVERIGEDPVAETPPVFIRFEADRRVSGSTGVNNFVGPATFEMGGLKFGALAVTRRAGPPALMEQEGKFLKSLDASTKYAPADAGGLRFTDAAGTVTLLLAPMNGQ